MGLAQRDDTDFIQRVPTLSSRGRMPSGKPNPVDTHVGNRMRLRRAMLGMTQEKLAEFLGLTFQQVQKYERGANRIGASRLWDLSHALQCPISFFFEEMNQQAADSSPRNISVDTPDPESHDGDQTAKRETYQLLRAYSKIVDTDLRRRIYELTKALATKESDIEAPARQGLHSPSQDLVDARGIEFQAAATINEPPFELGAKDPTAALKEPI